MKGFEVSANDGMFSGAMVSASSITISDGTGVIITVSNDILSAKEINKGFFADAMGSLAAALERASDETINNIRNGIYHFMESSDPNIAEEAVVLYDRIFMPALEM